MMNLLIGSNFAEFQQQFSYLLIPCSLCFLKCCASVAVDLFDVDVCNSKQLFNNSDVTILGGIDERSEAGSVAFVHLHITACQDFLNNINVTTLSGSIESCKSMIVGPVNIHI